jgi:hypothetical protein
LGSFFRTSGERLMTRARHSAQSKDRT